MIDKGNFIDNFNDECVSFIMGIENKDENVKDFHSFCKGKRINFKDNFGNIIVSVFVSEYKL